MRVHVFVPNYGESGEKTPCQICGYEYDWGSWYYFKPCPRCGNDPEDWPISRVIHALSIRLKTSQSEVRRAIAKYMEVDPKTLKNWQYRGVSREKVKEVLDLFRVAVKKILEEEENRKKVERYMEKMGEIELAEKID